MKMNSSTFIHTNDRLIRTAFRENLVRLNEADEEAKIIEELGVIHGAARVDIAVVNGIIHGYELKSDLDTLYRLPNQMKFYNSVFDQVTLVVGKNHLHEAIKIVPEWWGLIVARADESEDTVNFFEIRKSEENPLKESLPVAKLLWRHEALLILEKINQAKGVRSKPREAIYRRLASTMDQEELRTEVRKCLSTRTNWRSGRQLVLSGD